ncbi:MAG TPA: PKD domain-containing protein [Thermoleophilaceae bacterium]|nr:PKD domain-containing protein [Thermoleophilaceae bacterium]
MRVLALPVLAVLVAPGAALAAPGDPYVVYTANNYADGAVILRTDPATRSLVEISRNGPQGSLFSRPYDLAVEANGNLLVADMGTLCTPAEPRCAEDGRIIRVDPITGRQSLLAGGAPLVDPAGLAVAPNGAIYVADNYEADNSGRVIRIDPASGAQAVIAEGPPLDLPFGILVDRDGSLVVSNRVLPGSCAPALVGNLVRIQPNTGAQELLSSGSLFSYPLGVALDGAGRIVFANECGAPGLGRVVTDLIQELLTTNNAADLLVTPERLALDPAGDFLVSDWSLGDGDGGIVKVDAATGAQSLVRRGELFNHPLGIAAVVSRPPIAALGVPSPVAAGRRVTFDASASRDPEGLRLAYEWDLNDDGVFELGTGAVPTAARAWRRNGRVKVRVRVNDPHGGRAVAQGVIDVDGSIPRITKLTSGSRVLGIGRRTRRARRARKRPPPSSTSIRFQLSEPADARVTIERTGAGQRNSNPREIEKAGQQGLNKVAIRARGLRPGRYRLLVEASDAVGHDATARKLILRVVRLARR